MLDTVKAGEKHVVLIHLKELMADASMYGWRPVLAYYGVWLQKLQNGRAEWHNAELKIEFRRALVWNSARPSIPRPQTSLAPQTSAAPRQNQTKDTTTKPASAPPGTKACALFNDWKCGVQADHPSDRNICTYLLHVAKRVCLHQERFCRWKIYDQAAKN